MGGKERSSSSTLTMTAKLNGDAVETRVTRLSRFRDQRADPIFRFGT